MKNKKVTIGILIVVVIFFIICVNPIRTMYYNKQYTEELNTLLNDAIKGYEYATSVSVVDMMTRERYILLEMSPEYNSLSREEKHSYMSSDLGEKLQRVYSHWVGEYDIYNNKLWECEALTYLDIAIVMNCEDKTYKYGYYEEDKYYDFVGGFVDADGTYYRFLNDTEKDKYYDSWSDYYSSMENSNKEDYNSLTYYTVTDDDTLGEVWAMAKSFVKDKLKSPKSADFPVYGDTQVSIKNSGNYYKVTGYVDAENSFGAEIRATFSLVMEKSGSKYILKECNIYE